MSRSKSRAKPAQRTTARTPRSSIREITGAIAAIALSPIEEDFFRAGDAMGESPDFSDLDEGYRPTTLWGAIVEWLRGERDRHPD